MSGSLSLGLNPSSELTPLNINASGELIVTTSGGGGGTTNVDIVADSVGLATESTLSNVDSNLLSIDSYSSTIESNTSSMDTLLTNIDTNIVACDTGSVIITSSALPSGAATSAAQSSTNASLATISGDTTSMDGKMNQGYDAQVASGGSGLQQVLAYGRDNAGNLDALKTTAAGNLECEISGPLGSDVSANSVSVVIASDQGAVSTIKPDASVTTDSLAPLAGSTAVTTGVDLDGTNGNLTFFGVSSNTTDSIIVEFSDDNVTYYPSNDFFVNMDTNGNYGFSLSNLGVRYVRLKQVDSVSTAWTWTSKASKK